MKTRVLVLALVLLIAGCATGLLGGSGTGVSGGGYNGVGGGYGGSNSNMTTWTMRLNPLVGQTRDSVLLAVGPPTSMTPTDSIEVWLYHESMGATGQVYGNTYRTRERFREIFVYFKSGRMTRWTWR